MKKTLQILEVLAGAATFLCGFLAIYYVSYPMHKGVAELHDEPFNYDWTTTFLILILPTFLIAVGSYFHAFKKSSIGFAVIIIFGGMVSLFGAVGHAIGFLIGSNFKGYFPISLSPGFFAFTTIVLALYNKLRIFDKNGKIS